MSAIRRVYELFQDESKWTQRAFARDNSGAQVHEDNSSAVCWCLAGALWKCDGDNFDRATLLDIAVRLYNVHMLTNLNDHSGYDAVMKVLETAVEETKS